MEKTLNNVNCPNCKNPISVNSTECEWCGNSVIPSNKGSNFTLNFYLKASKWNPSVIVMVFVDGVLIKEFLVKEGCDFDYKLTTSEPEISVSLNGGKNIYKIPKYVFDFKNKKYRLIWANKGIFRLIWFNKPIIIAIE